jgi:hypothetical protein
MNGLDDDGYPICSANAAAASGWVRIPLLPGTVEFPASPPYGWHSIMPHQIHTFGGRSNEDAVAAAEAGKRRAFGEKPDTRMERLGPGAFSNPNHAHGVQITFGRSISADADQLIATSCEDARRRGFHIRIGLTRTTE